MGNLKVTLLLYKYLWTSQGKRSLNQSLRRLRKRMLTKANKGIMLEWNKLSRMKISMLRLEEIKLMETNSMRVNKALMKVLRVVMAMIRIKISLSPKGQK